MVEILRPTSRSVAVGLLCGLVAGLVGSGAKGWAN